jgi:hypothetical protein
MAFETTGKIIDIGAVNQVSEKKEAGGAAVFIDYIKFQLTQDKCDLINESFLNEDVKIWFNLRGNKWERDGKINYFTNLDVWKIEKLSSLAGDQDTPSDVTLEDIPPENDELSDLPF